MSRAQCVLAVSVVLAVGFVSVLAVRSVGETAVTDPVKNVAVSTSSSTTTAIEAPGAVAKSIQLPPPLAPFDYQLGGAYEPSPLVRVVGRDHEGSPSAGRYNVCYVNAFQTQPEDEQWWRSQHAAELARSSGRVIEDPDWPGELLLDTSSSKTRAALFEVVRAWIDECAQKQFAAVEFDNLDSWTRAHGSLSVDGNLAYATLITRYAHDLGLAVAQKNAAELTAEQSRSVGFDFAVVEECAEYDECARYTEGYGGRVYDIEYGSPEAFRASCREIQGQGSMVRRDRDLTSPGNAAYQFALCAA